MNQAFKEDSMPRRLGGEGGSYICERKGCQSQKTKAEPLAVVPLNKRGGECEKKK